MPELQERPGSASWSPPRPVESPAAAGDLAGPELQECFATWVQELHRELSAHPQTGEPREGSAHE